MKIDARFHAPDPLFAANAFIKNHELFRDYEKKKRTAEKRSEESVATARIPRFLLNQSIVDALIDAHPTYYINENQLGKLKRSFEKGRNISSPWFWPFVLFKYAVFIERIIMKLDMDMWIFDKNHTRFSELWNG
jgi:hypothetical protein